MKKVILVLIQFQLSVKLLHWSPPNNRYAEHKALGELYDYLEDKIDLLVEASTGSRKNDFDGITSIGAVKLENIEILFGSVLNQLRPVNESWFDNQIEEIKAEINKTRYLLELQ